MGGKGKEQNMWVTIKHGEWGERETDGEGVTGEGNELRRWGGGRKEENGRKKNEEWRMWDLINIL